jgi:hypothetical protein
VRIDVDTTEVVDVADVADRVAAAVRTANGYVMLLLSIGGR